MSPEGIPQSFSSEEEKKPESIGKRAENYRDDDSISKKVTSIRETDNNLAEKLEAMAEKKKSAEDNASNNDLADAA